VSHSTRPRRLADGQQLALLPTSIEEDGDQLDLVEHAGVETLSPTPAAAGPLVLLPLEG